MEQKWLLALFLDPGPYSYSQALPFVWTEQAWPLALLHCLGCEGSSDWPCVRHIWMILLLFTGNEIWSVNTLVALDNGWRRPGLFALPVMEDKLVEKLTLCLFVCYTVLCAFH